MSMIKDLQGVVDDMEAGVFDYTVDGKCSSCGNCCSNFLPMSSKEIKEIRRYVKKKNIQEQVRFAPVSQPAIDLTCPFRSEKERKCLIYEKRPAICRDFQCDKPRKKIAADKEMYHGKYTVVDMRYEFFRK